VALSGEGGDEVFGGYHRHVFGPPVWRQISRAPFRVRRLAGRLILRVPPSGLDSGDRFISPLLPQRLQQSHVGDRLHNLASALGAWAEPTKVIIGGTEPRLLLAEVLERSSSLSFVDQMLLADQLSYVPDMNLARVDRMSMASSLEVRVPLLDHRVVELSWQMSLEAKIRAGQGR